MEDELKFLTDADQNISEAEICEYVDENHKSGMCITLSVGPSDSELDEMIKKNNGVLGSEPIYYEILLTEKDLKKILKLMREY